MTRILVMTPESQAVAAISAACPDAEIVTAATFERAAADAGAGSFELAFVDIDLVRPPAGGGGADPLRDLEPVVSGARVVVMSPPEETRDAVNLVRDGAGDYLAYPLVGEEVELVRQSVERRERLRWELRYLRDRSLDAEVLGTVSSRAGSMKEVLRKIRQVAPTRSTVLLTGETGTGKSFLARVIHQHSTRAARQFVSVHCGAIPDSLLESELFGHERGAFTGADRRKLGKFEIAHGGTIFLDEVATVSTAMQVKLLNVLQERSVQRVGGERDVEVDVRVLAATNTDLEHLTRDGSFRSDLFYRLNVFPIEVPPLRERLDDIPIFVDGFLDRLRRYHQKEVRGVDDRVMEAFRRYGWPGNVRELENLLERAFILETSDVLMPSGFPPELFGSETRPDPARFDPSETLATARARAAAAAERAYLERQLALHGGRIGATAAAAGLTARQLNTLMRRHGLRKEDFRGGGTDDGAARPGAR